MRFNWYEAAADLMTAGIAVYYWSMRRTYGALMRGATLFENLKQQRRLSELEDTEHVASARAAAERERDAHEVMLKAVIANSQSLIYVKDLEGRYLLANEPFERAFAVSASDLLGQTDEYLDPEMAPIWRANDFRARSEQFAVEEWSNGPDGRIDYETVKFPLHDADGQVFATCGISLDVTQRRRANEEMARARDAALAATAAKSAFLATMSHEIRTPMNAVIGLTGLLLDTTLDDQQRDLMETVRSSGDALLVVINDILDFSKIEAGDLHLERQAFTLRSCAEGSMDLVAQAAAAKGLDLVLDVAESCPRRLIGDAARLRQVLVNLLNNAVKFTAAGDVLLTITASEAPGASTRLTFSVRDTGIGIPADRIDRLFQSFSQVDASTTRVYGGTGLGLAISRGLVRSMGGDLVVHSVPGEGSTFAFTGAFGVSDLPEPAEPMPATAMAGRSALIVDDNETNRRVLNHQLAGWGLRTTCVAGPEEALALLAGGASFDLALLDMHMPVMDGDQLAVALRALPNGRSMPMVMLRSLGPLPAPRSGTAFVAVLTKPVKLAALLTAVRGALGGTARATVDAPAAVAGSAGNSGLRVLLAEDNAVNQKVAKLLLAKLGYDADAVDNGEEAVAALTASRYDLVLMDIHMPRMDGLTATRFIRAQIPAARQPRIVALTASAMLEDRQACTEAGMDGYLVKPFRQEQLAAVLDGAVLDGVGTAGRPPLGFDPTTADQLVAELGGDVDLRTELLTDYLRESGERIAELTAGGRTGDRDAVRAAAHSLRSASQVLGMSDLAASLKRLETAAQAEGGELAAEAEAVAAQHRSAASAIAELLASQPRLVLPAYPTS